MTSFDSSHQFRRGFDRFGWGFAKNEKSGQTRTTSPPLFDTLPPVLPHPRLSVGGLRVMLLHRSRVPLLMCAARVVTLPPPLLHTSSTTISTTKPLHKYLPPRHDPL